MTDRDIVEAVEGEVVQLGTLKAAGPQDVIAQASSIATELAQIIDKRRLFITIGRRKFVRVEGWTTLGAMLGILPREVDVHRHDDGTYEARVELIRANDAVVVGRGSAICGIDEPRWAKGPEYARRSMAITRATGKAYRLAFSWIVTLAGYEPTPAEEMPDEPEHPRRRIAETAKPNGRPYDPQTLKAAIDGRIIKATPTMRGAIASAAQKGLIANKLEECFAPAQDAKEKRHTVTEWLVGRASTAEMTMAEASAILDWLLDKDADHGTYDLHKAARSEAAAILSTAEIEAGQQPLDLRGDDAAEP